MVELLNKQGAKYSHFDILTDNDVRQGNRHVIDKNIVHVVTNSLFLIIVMVAIINAVWTGFVLVMENLESHGIL